MSKRNEKQTSTNEHTARIGEGLPGPGRPKGIPNKTTRDVREAIAAFAQSNVHKLQEWLDAIAEEDPPARLISTFE